MADSDAPQMPLAASSNMAMTMSIAPATLKKSSDEVTDPPTAKQHTLEEIDTQSHSAQSGHSQQAASTAILLAPASMSSQLMVDVQNDRAPSREKVLGIQRIQLAEQLSNERKLCMDLEARVTDLQDELYRLKSSNEVLETECGRLHGQIDEAVQQLESQTTEARQQDKVMLERVGNLESKLDEAVKSLEQAMLSRDILQKAHDEAVKTCDHQAHKIEQLDNDLEVGRAKTHELNAMYDRLQEKHDNELKLTISGIEKSHESRERDLQQRLAAKDDENKALKREITTLRTACADAVTKKEAAQKELCTKTEDLRMQASQEQQQLAEARDQALAESRKLQQSLDELQRSIGPFAQIVVICIDVSGSTVPVAGEIKQACRDVLHKIKSNNSDAKVAVVIHGSYERHDPSPVQAISGATFQIVDSIDSTWGGIEDYTYCLEQANNIFEMDSSRKKLIVLIGDGDARCSDQTALVTAFGRLKSAEILAHSIIIPNHSKFGYTPRFDMQDISGATGGRVEYKDTYLSALDELLRHEREQYFKAP
ncbi:hypothetical protein AAE478_003813 [Parahypoxylon ruwenzoriense]